MKKTLQDFAREHRMLFWDMSPESLSQISDDAVIERFLAFGDWDQVREMETILEKRKLGIIFTQLAGKKRCNLRPETVSYFRDYYLHA